MPRLAEGGTAIAAGEPIGRIGRTGVTYGTHLFFGVLAAGRAIDPDLLLQLPSCSAATVRAAAGDDGIEPAGRSVGPRE